MFQVPVSDAFSFHKPQRDLKACQEETNWIGKTLDQSEAQDGFEDDATPSTRCTSTSFGSLKSPPRWLDRSFDYCGIVARLMAMVTVVLFAAFLIYLHFDVSQTGASVGARVKFSFVRCWPDGRQIYSRCPFQIALSLDSVGGIKHKNIIAVPVVENITAPPSGRWEGEYFVGVQFKSVSSALDFENALFRKSEVDLLKQSRKNFLALGYPVNGIAAIDVRRVCTSADVVEEELPDTESIQVAEQQDAAANHRVKVPRCMYNL